MREKRRKKGEEKMGKGLKWAGIGVFALAVLAMAGAYLWASSLFTSSDAKDVRSVAGALKAHRVLDVFAHPDDEQLVTGLVTAAKKEGAFVAQITVTRGEAGHQVPVVARQSELGIIRWAEELKAGFALGVDEQQVWDYPDSGVPDVPLADLTARIEKAIRRYRPDLVVTFWPASGATGHKDHRRVGLATLLAVQAVHDAPQGGYAGPANIAFPLTPSKAMRKFGGETGAFVADNQPAPDYRSPASYSAKLRGWKIHASQADYTHEAYGVPDWLLYLIWDEELYAVRPGSEAGEIADK